MAKDSIADFSTKEIDSIDKIVKTTDFNQRKNKLNDEIKKSNNDNYKNLLLTKIAVEQEKSIISVTNIPSKYDNKTKTYSCWDGTGSQAATAVTGNVLWRFNLRINACADYSTIYSGFVRSTWADIYAIGWSYYGETPDRYFEYRNNTEYVASRQGLFKLCVNSNWVCIQEYRPWVEYHATRQGYNDYSY